MHVKYVRILILCLASISKFESCVYIRTPLQALATRIGSFAERQDPTPMAGSCEIVWG